jgi:hypothetical protein
MDDDRTRKEGNMWTVIDVTTGEALRDGEWPFDACPVGCRQATCTHGEPVLFDTEGDAYAWATAQGYANRDHRTEEV